MKYKFLWLISTALYIILYSCESANIEDKYMNKNPNDSIPGGDSLFSEIIWLPLNGNLKDTSGNKASLMLVGTEKFVSGINADHGKGLYLDGSTYLMINIGFFDTLSVAFWIKGDAALESSNTPVLFDYGFNAFSTELDATTGATSLSLMKNEDIAYSHENPSVEYLNSFNRYSFVYVEAGGNKTRVYFKGYTSDGNEIIYSDEFDFSGIIEAETDILYIGRSSQRENQSSTYFKGAIDEIHIYNKALSNTEIENMALIPTN
jgi:hypothetical protein